MAQYPLGIIIRQRRDMLGLSQQQLCQGICDRSTLSRIERGDQVPPTPPCAPCCSGWGWREKKVLLVQGLCNLLTLAIRNERQYLVRLRIAKVKRLHKPWTSSTFFSLQPQPLQQGAQGRVGGNLVAALDAGEGGAVADALAQLLLAQAQHIAPLADDDAEGILCHQEHLLFAFWKGDSGVELPFSIV